MRDERTIEMTPTQPPEQEIEAGERAEVIECLCDAIEERLAAGIVDEPEFRSSIRRTGCSTLQIKFDRDTYSVVVRYEGTVGGRDDPAT